MQKSPKKFLKCIAVCLIQVLVLSNCNALALANTGCQAYDTLAPTLTVNMPAFMHAYKTSSDLLPLDLQGVSLKQVLLEYNTKDQLDELIRNASQKSSKDLFRELSNAVAQIGFANVSAKERYLFIKLLSKGKLDFLSDQVNLNPYIYQRLTKLFEDNSSISFASIAKEMLAAELDSGNTNLPLDAQRISGMPKILLVGPYRSELGDREIGAFLSPPLGVHRIASFARQFGVQADVYDIDLLGIEGLIEKVKKEKYDFIMFSVYHQTIANGLNGIHQVKQAFPDAIIVAGGQGIIDRGPINNVDFIFKHAPVDIMVRGFGEFSVLDMAVSLDKNNQKHNEFDDIPGLLFRDKRAAKAQMKYSTDDFRVVSYSMDYSEIPQDFYWQNNTETMGQRDILKMARLITESHCPFNCTFCSSRVFLDIAIDGIQPVLYLSPQDSINLLNKFIAAHPEVEAVYLHDDDFFLNKKRVAEFVYLIQQGKLNKDLKFFAQGRTDDLDKPMLRKLYDVGFRLISYGQESGSQKMLNALRKDSDVTASSDMLAQSYEVGIIPHINLILFPPKTTLADIQKTVEMALPLIEQGAHIAISGRVLVLPGASMAEEGYEIEYRSSEIAATGEIIQVPFLFKPVDPRMQEIAEKADSVRDSKVEALRKRYPELDRLPQQIDGLSYFWAVYSLADLATDKIEYVIHRLIQQEINEQRRAKKTARAFSLGEKVRLPDLTDMEIVTAHNENNAQLLIVSDCPLRCRFCINFEFTQDGVFRHKFLQWDEAEYRQLLKKLKKAGITAVTLTGGEPSYHPNLVDFVRVAKEEGLRIRITSNGLGLNKKILTDLQQAKLDNLTFSVFSFDEMQYRKISVPELALIQDKAGLIEPVLAAIKQNIKDALSVGLDPRLNVIITRDTYPDGTRHIINEARAMGVRKFQLKELSVEEGIRFTQDQYVEIDETILGELFPKVDFYKNPRFQTDDMKGFVSYNEADPNSIDLSVVLFSFEKAKRMNTVRDIFVNPFAPIERFATSGRDPKTSASALLKNGELIQLARQTVPAEENGKNLRIGFLHGRYQPPHFGHLDLIRKALEENDKVIVLVGADKADSEKNPIPQGVRVRALQTFFPQEIMEGSLIIAFNDDIQETEILKNVNWGQRYYNFVRELMPDGNITVYTGPEGDKGWWDRFSDVQVKRSEKRLNNISATQIREGALAMAPDLSYQLLREARQVEHEKPEFEWTELPEIIPEFMDDDAMHFGAGICLETDYNRFFKQAMPMLWADGNTGFARLAGFLSSFETPGSGFILRLPKLKREQSVYAPGMGLGICPQKRITALGEQKIIAQEAARELFPDLIVSPQWTQQEYDHYIYYHIASTVLSSLFSDIVALWHLSDEEVKKGLSLLPEEERYRSVGLLDLYRQVDSKLSEATLEKFFHALLELNISEDEQPLRDLVGQESKALEQIIERFSIYAKKDRKWFGALYSQRLLHPELNDWGKRQQKGVTYNKFISDFGGRNAKQKINSFLLHRFNSAMNWQKPFDPMANRSKALLNFLKSQEVIFFRFRGLGLTETGLSTKQELERIIEQLEKDMANEQWWDDNRVGLAISALRQCWGPMIDALHLRGFISAEERMIYLRYYPYQENRRFYGKRYNDTTVIEHAESMVSSTRGDIAEARIIDKHLERSRKYRATIKTHREYPTSPLVSTALIAETEDGSLLFEKRDGKLALPERFVLADSSLENNVDKLVDALGITRMNDMQFFDFATDPQRNERVYVYTAVANIKAKKYSAGKAIAVSKAVIDIEQITPEHREIIRKYLFGYNAVSRAHYLNNMRVDQATGSVVKQSVDPERDKRTAGVHAEFAGNGLTQPLIAADAIIEYVDAEGEDRGVLLVKRSGDNQWATIGGFANRYESAEHSIARKVYEKIGFKNIQFKKLLRLATHPDRDERLYVWAPAFVVKVQGELPQLKQDVIAYTFVKSEAELDKLLARKDGQGGVWADHYETLRNYFRQKSRNNKKVLPPFDSSAEVFIDRVEEYELGAVEKSLGLLIDAADKDGMLFDSVYTVLVKPSLASMYNARTRTTTHPVVIEAMISYLKKRGVRRIIFGDGGFHGGNMEEIFSELGLYDLAAKYNVTLVDLNKCKAYNVNIPRRPGQAYETVQLADMLKDIDLLVNMPKLKTHGQMTITGATKNLKGVTTPSHKRAAHQLLKGEVEKDFGQEAKLSQAIVDNTVAVSMAIPKQLIVVDGIEGMEGFGPTHGDIVKSKCLLVGTNPLVVDTTIANIMRVDPNEIPSIRIARKLGYWKPEPVIKGLVAINEIARKFVMPKKLTTKDYGHFEIVVPEDTTGICSSCMGVLAVEYQLSKPEWKQKCKENGIKFVVYIGRIAPQEPLPEGYLPVYVGICPLKYAKAKGLKLDEQNMIKVCAPGTASVMEVINSVYARAIETRFQLQNLLLPTIQKKEKSRTISEENLVVECAI
ncbi:MAG: DUF362 domain-containing protein [Candidatus Omnitrophota bacterium]